MNILYLTFLEDSELYLGVKKKILGQVKAFEKLGYSVSYSFTGKDKFAFYGANKEQFILNSSSRLIKQYCEHSCDYINRHDIDVLYFRVDRLSSDIMRVLKTAKAKNAKVILEIPNYPYIGDYINGYKQVSGFKTKAVSFIKALICAVDDRLSGLRLSGKADAVVLFGNKADSFFGVPAKNFDNGISVDDFSPIDILPTKDIRFITVAGTLWWQGYERVLEGMSEYRKNNPDSEYTFKFTLVGGDKKEMPKFKQLVSSLGLDDCVDCVGFKTGEELLECYRKANIGISTLGCYKRGLVYCSSLKSREYMAQGLPFIYAYEDKLLDGQGFAKKYSNDASVIDMESIIKFFEKTVNDRSILEDERRIAKEKFDWLGIMKEVLELLVQGEK